MGHKCFISYKKEDKTYKNYLVELFAGQDVIDNPWIVLLIVKMATT